jgi:hypothetical protein
MAQGTPQFSPSQVLEAGRRAEAEGKIDYALQFYRHLVTHFASSPEATAAREGLDRIERGGSSSIAAPRTAPGTPPSARSGRPPSGAPGASSDGATGTRSPPYLNGSDPHHSFATSSWPGPGMGTPASPVPGTHPMPPRAGNDPPLDAGMYSASSLGPIILPEAEDNYRMGRWLARIFAAVGWLMFLGGIGLSIVLQSGPQPALGPLNNLMAFGPTPFFAVVGSVSALGLWLVFSGQRARAAFDTANSSQELVAIERAKFGRGGH